MLKKNYKDQSPSLSSVSSSNSKDQYQPNLQAFSIYKGRKDQDKDKSKDISKLQIPPIQTNQQLLSQIDLHPQIQHDKKSKTSRDLRQTTDKSAVSGLVPQPISPTSELFQRTSSKAQVEDEDELVEFYSKKVIIPKQITSLQNQRQGILSNEMRSKTPAAVGSLYQQNPPLFINAQIKDTNNLPSQKYTQSQRSTIGTFSDVRLNTNTNTQTNQKETNKLISAVRESRSSKSNDKHDTPT
ncbi:MAG: hypothetical protein EZS28_013347 [Streblomastix strix]|uniref:Uncharacterized protein n=1 Tax=Streblomastix strix TaxID=222440 RepID=A0A5J4W8V1_9EUKA|nr:MAG: hypothetical protein EZS28_013347 [Streblomastix strix]